MSAPTIAFRSQSRARAVLGNALAFPEDLAGESAGLVFDMLLAAAAQDAGCRPATGTPLEAAERDDRRAELLRLWQSCSSRVIDESLVADLVARRGSAFLALARARTAR